MKIQRVLVGITLCLAGCRSPGHRRRAVLGLAEHLRPLRVGHQHRRRHDRRPGGELGRRRFRPDSRLARARGDGAVPRPGRALGLRRRRHLRRPRRHARRGVGGGRPRFRRDHLPGRRRLPDERERRAPLRRPVCAPADDAQVERRSRRRGEARERRDVHRSGRGCALLRRAGRKTAPPGAGGYRRRRRHGSHLAGDVQPGLPGDRSASRSGSATGRSAWTSTTRAAATSSAPTSSPTDRSSAPRCTSKRHF